MIMVPTKVLVALMSLSTSAHPLAADGVTSLTNPAVKYSVPAEHHVVLKRGPVTAVVVDNHEVNLPDVPNHRARYNGLAVLKHTDQPRNIFVPSYAGLNFEHIHDGTNLSIKDNKFEPREEPMELRVIDEHTVEVYQAPTKVHQLESCGRYSILPDGTIEYTFECIPRAGNYRNDYIGLFWASYIDQPEDKGIHFKARLAEGSGAGHWTRTVTPKHGVSSSHPPAGPLPTLKHDPDFTLTLAFNRSDYVYTEPWYYGVSHGMAYALMFRKRDGIWLVQSPSGGGDGNPAWDFQWFIPHFKVDEAYGFTMRAGYVPFENSEQVERAMRDHLRTLNPER